jgi:hypothetical protein
MEGGGRMGVKVWRLSSRADPEARVIADRHYNRQKPGTPQFVPPGRCLVMLANGPALWVTSWPFAKFVRHAWAGAWVCSAFRREGGIPASEMIREAVAVTRWRWPDVPVLGMITFVDRSRVRPTRVHGDDVWGWTYLRAGFRVAGETAGGLLALQMRPEDMPEAQAPIGSQVGLMDGERDRVEGYRGDDDGRAVQRITEVERGYP